MNFNISCTYLKVSSVEVEFFVEKQLHQVSIASHCDVVQRGQPVLGKCFSVNHVSYLRNYGSSY